MRQKPAGVVSIVPTAVRRPLKDVAARCAVMPTVLPSQLAGLPRGEQLDALRGRTADIEQRIASEGRTATAAEAEELAGIALIKEFVSDGLGALPGFCACAQRRTMTAHEHHGLMVRGTASSGSRWCP